MCNVKNKSIVYFCRSSIYPLSFSPTGEKIKHPSPVGEVPIAIGRERDMYAKTITQSAFEY
jgi:hypothetical protein